MRPAILIYLFVICGYITNAQVIILPQVGFENYRTSIQINKNTSFAPFGAQLSPQAGIRLEYKSKRGNGPFLGISPGQSMVKINFSDPQTAMNSFTAANGKTQIRLEGGYQVSTKPIYFKKAELANINKARSAKGSWVTIQPSLGVAYSPFAKSSEINAKSMGTQTRYTYNAGNWNTALITGIGFTFGENKKEKFVLSINYFKGIGNLGVQTFAGVPGKSAITTLASDVSGWNFKIGIPFSLGKKKSVALQPVPPRIYNTEHKCGQYKYGQHRCGQYIHHCGGVI